jgi:hypothetical protein
LTSEFETPLKDDDVAILKDTYVNFDGDDYDVHEEVVLGNSKLNIQTSLTSDADYADEPVLEIGRDDVKYFFKFDDEIDTGDVSEDTPLRVELLGKELKIVDFGTDSVEVRLVEDEWMNVGDTMSTDGYKVSLVNVGENDVVLVEVEKLGDSTRKIIDKGEEVTVLGLRVAVLDVFYSGSGNDSSAVLAFGEEVTKRYYDGDAFIGEDEDEPTWVWDITCSDNAVEKPVLGVSYDLNKDDETDSPPGIGESIELPYKYVTVYFDSLTEEEYGEYRLWQSDSFDLSDAGYGTSEDVFILESTSDEEGLFVDSDDAGTDLDYYTDELYLYEDTSGDLLVFYRDTDDRDVHKSTIEVAQFAGFTDIAQLKFDDTEALIKLHGSSNNPEGEDLKFVFENVLGTSDEEIIVDLEDVAGDLEKLGSLADDAEASDVHVTGITADKDVGTYDEDVLTEYGNILDNPEDNANDDKVMLYVPAGQVKATVIISSEETTSEDTEDTETGDVIKEVKPIRTAVAKLDTEISDPATISKHLILVGDAAVNRLAAKARGVSYPTYGSAGVFEFGEGEAVIKIYDGVFKEGQQVVLVAGWTADDTRLATLVAQNWQEHLDGETATAVLVSGTPSNPVITPV